MQQIKKNTGNNVKLIIIILISALLTLLIVGSTVFAVQLSKLNYDKIYEGVSVGSTDVSNMTLEEAENAIEQAHDIGTSRQIRLFCDDAETSFSLDEINISVNAKQSAQNAFAVGRDGKWHDRLKQLSKIKKNGLTTDVVLSYSDEILNAKIDEIANIVDSPERELTVELKGNELVITRGKKGMRILKETAKKLIDKAIIDDSISEVELKTEEVIPPELTVDYLTKEICTEPQDASYKIENQRLTIIDEKMGVKIDTKKASTIIKETPGDVVRIPAEITSPDITAENIKNTLFPDMLATYSTNFSSGNVPRSHNIALACDFISETVLAPGDVFSYNDTVGPRTAERGFREAGVYVGNKVEQGLGGGICQVSTTLFNAVVMADLNIVYRTNHSMPVSYAPPGRDATVSYGSIDFKFSNNTNAPIKLIASANNGVNIVTVYGTKKNPGRTVEITSECTGSWAPKTKEIEDPTLPEGTTKVDVSGSNGSSYVAYKITKENGNIIKKEQLTKSTYSATDRVVRVGTKKEEDALETASPSEEPASSETTPAPGAEETPSTPVPNSTTTSAEQSGTQSEVTAPPVTQPVTPPAEQPVQNTVTEPIAETPVEQAPVQ